MQSGKSIINLPLLVGMILSVALHAAALYGKGLHTPAKPVLQTGRTVVQLTLIPTAASRAAVPAPPQAETVPDPIQEPEPVVAPAPVPMAAPQPEPTPPQPEPVAETATADSQEQIATLQEDKGVVTEATPLAGISASYPRMSQRRGEEGTVVLAIEVLASGKAGTVEIIESSGFRRLDDAAIAAAKNARYIPAKQFGRNVDSKLIQPLMFELTQTER
jgi:protein TonB